MATVEQYVALRPNEILGPSITMVNLPADHDLTFYVTYYPTSGQGHILFHVTRKDKTQVNIKIDDGDTKPIDYGNFVEVQAVRAFHDASADFWVRAYIEVGPAST